LGVWCCRRERVRCQFWLMVGSGDRGLSQAIVVWLGGGEDAGGCLLDVWSVVLNWRDGGICSERCGFGIGFRWIIFFFWSGEVRFVIWGEVDRDSLQTVVVFVGVLIVSCGCNDMRNWWYVWMLLGRQWCSGMSRVDEWQWAEFVRFGYSRWCCVCSGLNWGLPWNVQGWRRLQKSLCRANCRQFRQFVNGTVCVWYAMGEFVWEAEMGNEMFDLYQDYVGTLLKYVSRGNLYQEFVSELRKWMKYVGRNLYQGYWFQGFRFLVEEVQEFFF